MMVARFCLQNIGKAYRRRFAGRGGAPVIALAGVSLAVAGNEISALTGRSGAGKSTLARILIGLEEPDSGEVFYNGRPLAATPQREFRRSNQMVFQNPLLAVNPLFTVRQIIAEPLRVLPIPARGSVGRLVDDGRIQAAMEHLELPLALLERRPHELSGGELQRVALARALVLEPEFLVLDEPFSALDDLTAMRLLRLLKGLFRRLRLGALFVSHHPRHVAMLADRVITLEQGKLADRVS